MTPLDPSQGMQLTLAQLKALKDLSNGPVFRQPCGMFQAIQPNRLIIRRSTIQNLAGRRHRGETLIDLEDLPDYQRKVTITQSGRAYLLQHLAALR